MKSVGKAARNEIVGMGGSGRGGCGKKGQRFGGEKGERGGSGGGFRRARGGRAGSGAGFWRCCLGAAVRGAGFWRERGLRREAGAGIGAGRGVGGDILASHQVSRAPSSTSLARLVVRHRAAEGRPEGASMAFVAQVAELVGDHVVHQAEGGLDDSPVEADYPARMAASSALAGLPDQEARDRHVELRGPVDQALGEAGLRSPGRTT